MEKKFLGYIEIHIVAFKYYFLFFNINFIDLMKLSLFKIIPRYLYNSYVTTAYAFNSDVRAKLKEKVSKIREDVPDFVPGLAIVQVYIASNLQIHQI